MPAAGYVTKRGFLARLADVYFEPNTGCWLWSGRTDRYGYGVTILSGKSTLAHRASYIHHKGSIGDGLYVLHKCDVPSCVNPDHLYEGNHLDNMRDMRVRKRNKSIIGQRGIKRKGYTYNRRPSKLTDAQVIEIFNAAGSHSEIAKIYGVCRETVTQIKSGRQRRKVARPN